MTFIRVYLAAYFALIAAAVIELWRSGILAELPAPWVVFAVLIAVGLGVLLAFAFRRDVPSGG